MAGLASLTREPPPQGSPRVSNPRESGAHEGSPGLLITSSQKGRSALLPVSVRWKLVGRCSPPPGGGTHSVDPRRGGSPSCGPPARLAHLPFLFSPCPAALGTATPASSVRSSPTRHLPQALLVALLYYLTEDTESPLLRPEPDWRSLVRVGVSCSPHPSCTEGSFIPPLRK